MTLFLNFLAHLILAFPIALVLAVVLVDGARWVLSHWGTR